MRRLPLFRPLGDKELGFVKSLKRGEQTIPERTDILSSGPGAELFTLLSGWAIRYLLSNRGDRQILDILLPGDLIGLQAPITGRVRHSVRSVTPVVLCILDGARFRLMFERFPEFAEALLANQLLDEHRSDQRQLALGRLRSMPRLAYLFVELSERLAARGEPDRCSFDLPLSYQQIADITGMSRSQVGASLIELKERGWASLEQRRLRIHDLAALYTAAGYRREAPPPTRTLV